MFGIIENLEKGRLVCCVSQKGSHIKHTHPTKPNQIIFPNHGSQEVGKGLEKKIMKDAGLK